MEYTIIASGSKGNAVLVGDILIDMGIPWKDLEPYAKKAKHVLITHSHGDHYKKANLRHLRKKTIVTNSTLASDIHNYFQDKNLHFKSIMSMNHEDEFELDNYLITAFRCYHDIPCIGFKIDVIEDGAVKESILYATDTNSTIDFPKGIYSQIFLESNFDENKIKKAMETKSSLRARRNLRHLSKRKALLFYLENSTKETEFIELHKSDKFY